jgi:hypothetical protein
MFDDMLDGIRQHLGILPAIGRTGDNNPAEAGELIRESEWEVIHRAVTAIPAEAVMHAWPMALHAWPSIGG